jgi:deglycase
MKCHILVMSILLFFLSPIIVCAENEQVDENTLKSKRILMIMANSFIGFKESNDMFEREGATIVIASNSLSSVTASGVSDITVTPDILIYNVKVEDYDAVIFIGGPGSGVYFSERTVHKIAQEAVNQNKVVASIHLGTRILAEAGVLEGKKVAAYTSHSVKAKGAIVTCEDVERDGNIITARTQSSAKKFAEMIIAAMIK